MTFKGKNYIKEFIMLNPTNLINLTKTSIFYGIQLLKTIITGCIKHYKHTRVYQLSTQIIINFCF